MSIMNVGIVILRFWTEAKSLFIPFEYVYFELALHENNFIPLLLFTQFHVIWINTISIKKSTIMLYILASLRSYLTKLLHG